MGQILVRNLDDAVIEQLKARAASDSASLEQTVRDILTQATRPSRTELVAKIDELRAKTTFVPGADSTTFIREWRDRDPFSDWRDNDTIGD